MPIEDPTFGCGTFLPGMGPGNFSDFDGGGTIDGGGGDDPDPPDDTGPGDLDDVIIDDDTGIVHPPPGPATPRLTTTYWVCRDISPTERRCEPIIQNSDSVPPPNSHLSQATCMLTCDNPTGPGTPMGPLRPARVPPVRPPGPKTPGARPNAPGGGGGATCKCTITDHVFGPSISSGGFCRVEVQLMRTCVPLGTPNSGFGAIMDVYLAEGFKPIGGTGTAMGSGCNCGSNSCVTTFMTLIKACPDDTDDTSLGGGGGGAPGAPAPSLLDGEGGGGGGGGGAYGAPGGTQKEPLGVLGGGGGGGGGGAPGAPAPSLLEGGEGFTSAGTGMISEHQESSRSIISKTIQTKEIDLNDPDIIAMILRKKPSGIEDPDIAFNITPAVPTLVPNSKNTNLFKDRINSNVEYILSNRKLRGDWDSTRSAGVTPTTVYSSLKPEVQRILGEIRNYDGTLLSKNQIFSMLGTRILDGTISRVTLKYLQNFAESSKKRVPTVIKRSSNSKVNEVAVLALIDRNKYTLDPAKANGKMKNILPNWKTLSSDIDKYIEVSVGGEVRKYYVKDDDTFVDRSTLGISDGDYFDVKVGSKTSRLYTKSEKDHAFILPEVTRQKAISLLGGNSGRTLEVSASILSGIEFDYSLSTPRQDFYVLSCVLSSINTKPSTGRSFLLKDTTAQYALADTSTPEGIITVNEYIKYKANHRVFMLDDEDLMLDYITATSSLTLKQTDILFDSPKENKTIPLLTRQIPWYIMVYPTNRSDLNIFNSKSKIISLEASGVVGRKLDCKTTIVPEFSKQQTNKFIRTQTDGKTAVDVYGTPNTQTRITQITPTDKVFKTAYKENGSFVSAEKYTPFRKKTGLRIVKEIITELDTNYLLGLNGIGKSLTEFDVYSRLTLQQFNLLSRLQSFSIVKASIRNGIIANVKVIPPINRAAARISFQKTLLVRRREGASPDTFAPVKGTRSRETIIPPTTTGNSSFGPVPK